MKEIIGRGKGEGGRRGGRGKGKIFEEERAAGEKGALVEGPGLAAVTRKTSPPPPPPWLGRWRRRRGRRSSGSM